MRSPRGIGTPRCSGKGAGCGVWGGVGEEEIAKALFILNAERFHPPLDPQEVKATARSCSRYEPAADLFPLTEAGDAEFFAAANADSVRYDHRAKAWLHFREHYWEEQTDGEIHRLALKPKGHREAGCATRRRNRGRR